MQHDRPLVSLGAAVAAAILLIGAALTGRAGEQGPLLITVAVVILFAAVFRWFRPG